MKIAVCDNISQFHADRLRDPYWARKFPGSEWVTALYEREASDGLEVASGDVALERVRSGQWRAADVHVVQELDARHGRELCALGARPAVLTMLESPLVAFRWNDRLLRRCAPFEQCIGPAWALERIGSLRRSTHHKLRFPCFRRDSLCLEPDRTGARQRRVVLIAANKYWRERPLARVSNLRDGLRTIRHGFRRAFSPTFSRTRQWQLHDERLELLCHLAGGGMIDVWGKGWDNLSNLPRSWQARLDECRHTFCGPCDDKRPVLSKYVFALAFENTRVPGYVTEKVVDAMIAGCVPVYRGAPDIADHVPAGAILDLSRYGKTAEAVDRIRLMSDADVLATVSAGREFLMSRAGDRHSFEGFAERVISLVRGGAAE